MRTQALRFIVAGGLLVSSHLAAEPLSDLQTRLATMRTDQRTRIEVDIEFVHRGSAPLHLNREKRRGRAVIVSEGGRVKMIEQRWLGTSSRASVWQGKKGESDTELIEEMEAQDLSDPVAMIDLLLKDATLVSDEAAAWQDQPARLLVIRPRILPKQKEEPAAKGEGNEEGEKKPGLMTLDAKIWLDESGVPVALERSVELGLGPAVKMLETQTFTFQQSEGRLQVATVRKSYTGTALAVLRAKDDKKMKVTAIR